MSNTQGKSRKSLIIGIIAAVVVLAAVLVLLLTQCTGGNTGETTAPSTTEGAKVAETYDLYWNVDRALYAGMSEAGMSSRTQESDGFFHVRFFKDGEIVTLKVADRKTVNALEVKDLMGLEFDENGIVTGVIPLEELPCEQVAWQFYVQSAGGKLVKANSSATLNGMEVLLELSDKTGIWDMTGLSGEVGCEAEPIPYDRIYGIANADGEVTHIFLYARENYMRTHEAECEHCGKVVEWSEWTKETSIPNATGHFQLMTDITTTGQTSMPEDAKICLDLNGKRIDGKANSRVYSLHNPGTELAIMDTSEAKTGTIAAHGKGDQGMCVWLRYGVVYLYDGILDGSDATSIKNGCTVALQGNTYMYMYGGELIGGTSTYLKNENGSYTNGLGGTLAVGSKAKFVLNDGVIRDGFAESIVTKRDAKGQPTTYQRGIGGNVFLSTGSVFEMNGGVIKNGKAGNYGGNVMLDGTAEFTMNGGKIQGGTITGKGKNGGSIFIASKATFTLKSGTISGGSSRNCAGNIYTNGKFVMTGGYVGGGRIINWTTGKVTPESASRNVFIVNGDFRMYGGTIDGGVQAIDTDATKTVTRVGLTTYATITSKTKPSLTISGGGGGVVVNVGDLRDSAKIGVSTSVGLFSQVTSEANLDNFYSEIEGADVVYYEERLGLGRVGCLCGETETHLPGCDGKQLFWAPWTATDKLPTTTGNYYLLKDVTCGQQNMAADGVVNLDLNGHRVDGKTGRIYSMHYRVETKNEDETISYSYPAHLTITDTSEGRKGVMASHGTTNHQGSIAWLRYGDMTLIAGTLDASDYKLHGNWNAGTDGLFGTSDDTITGLAGAAISVPSGRTFNMYGGTVIGGETIAYEHVKTNTISAPEGSPEGTEPTVEELKRTVSASHGGALDVSGTVNMYGGTIRDGISGSTAGNVRVNASGKFYMYGGEIVGGTSTGNGGNIQLTGLMEMHGGKVIDGWAKNTAGNLHVSPGKLVMSGGYIGGGKSGAAANASADHANIFCVNGKMDLSGGEIAGCVRIIHYNTQGAEGGSVVNISGNPVISSATVDMILAPQGDKTDVKPTMPILNVVGPMTEGAMVEVNCATQGIDFAVGDGYTVTADDAKAFRINGTDIYAAADTENNSLFFGRYSCLCGKDEHTFGCQQVNGGKQLKWYAWTSKTTLPTTGNYYLANDVNGSGSTTVKSGTTLNLDLNGKTVSWEWRAYRIYDANAVSGAILTMTNTAATEGTIKAAEFSSSDQGCAVWLAGGEKATFNLLDGVVLDGSNHTISSVPSEKNGTGNTAEKNGGVVAAQSTSTFNMYGGTIIGANAVRSSEITLSNGTKYSAYAPNGGAVSIDGVMNMYGGTIRDGKTANQGGNVLVNGDMFMYGGVISGGHADGNAGNVFVHRNGELHMSGDARIENGTSAAHSGNLNVDGKMTMTDNAVVTGGTAGTGAGNINLNVYITGGVTYTGSLVMSGKASVTDGKASGDGGNIRLLKGAALTMSDETLVSGGVSNKDRGGNISVADTGAVLTMSGKASVIGGKAATNGGNINLSGASTMTATDDVLISGGEVCGAKGVESTGGNLGVTGNGAKATLSGNVKVLDGSSWHTGGNVRISQNATLIVKDNVLIDGGKSSNSKSDTTKALNDTNGNANIFSVNGILEIYGGKITGNINPISTKANGCVVKISGNAQIPAGASGLGIHMSSTSASVAPSLIQVVGAMTGAEDSVVVSNAAYSGVVGSGDGYTLTAEDAKVFAAAQKGVAEGCDILLSGNNLVIGGLDCLCGQETHTKACLELWNGERRLWTAWTSATSLPTTSGNYYLTKNVDFDWQQKNTKDSNVVIDLNGYTVTNDNGQRMFTNWESGGSLTITDKSEAQTGKVIGSGNAVDQGIIWVRYGTFNLVAGTIDASGFNLKNVWDTAKKTVAEKNGGAIWVSGGAAFNMYGGEIIGGNLITSTATVDGEEKSIYAPKGGAICSEGTTNIYDGIIRDGKSADQGGNVYVRKGTFTMYGGQIIDGTANMAGNVLIHKEGTMTLKEGVVISGGESLTGTGGNLKAEGKLIIEGATITDGVAKGNGGNVYMNSTGTVELKSGTISGGWSKNVSGNVHIDAGKFIMTGGTVSGGKTGADAVTTATHANIQSVNGTWEFLGGTVEGNSMVFNYDVNQTTYPTTVVGGNAAHTGNLHLNFSDGKAAPVITVNDDFAGNVVITSKAGGIFTANAVTAEQAKCFVSGDGTSEIIRLEAKHGVAEADYGKLFFGKFGCVCGASKNGGSHVSGVCDGTSHLWLPTDKILDTDGKGADLYYYLTKNVTTSTVYLTETAQNVTYDLNGFVITVNSGRMISTYKAGNSTVELKITLTNTGKVLDSGNIVVNNAGDEGRIIWFHGSKKTAVIYNVSINLAKAFNNTANTVAKQGIAFCVGGWSNSMSLYKVTAVGGNSASNGVFLRVAGSGNKALLDGCTITGCDSNYTAKEYGGNGGALNVGDLGTLTLNNTTVTGNNARNNGGGVYVEKGGKLVISGNTKITGNTVGTAENNVFVEDGGIIETGTLGSNAQVGLSAANGVILSTDATYAEMEKGFKADSKAQQLIHNDSGMSLADASAHIHCVCGGTLTSGEKLPDGTYHYCKDIVYTAMDKTGGAVTANTNWYLADDVTLTSQLGSAQYTLNLCLNGHNIDQSFSQRMIRTYAGTATGGRITLTSCVADKVVDGKATNNTISHKAGTFSNDNDGAIFWLTSKGTLEMYAGNLDGSAVTLKPNADDNPKHGICVKVEAGSTFKLYGGTLYGGKTLRGTNNNSEGVTVFSVGNILINGGKIVGGETVGSGGSLFLFTDSVTKIYGGTITGGKATSNGGNIHFEGKELLIAGGTIEKGTAGKRGGNVWFGVDGGTISGGTITGGNANDGGNVALNSNKTFTMTGGTITGGNSAAAGGNVWLMGTMKMSGGLIEKGTKAGNANHTGANMNMNSSGILDISGGTIKGRVCAAVAGPKVNISGSARIYETDTTNNLYVWGFTITFGKLNDDAKIGLLILKEDQATNVATVAEGVTLNLAQIPVNDVGLTDGATRTFAAQQDGTVLKIVETTK